LYPLSRVRYYTLSPPFSCVVAFPYTTLFRSSLPCPARPDGIRPPASHRNPPPAGLRAGARRPAGRSPAHRDLGSRQTAHDRCAEDRKSTRLNSSHVKISYAVFCLKKKRLWIL